MQAMSTESHVLPQYPEQWTFDEVTDARVVTVQCFSLLFSTLVLILGSSKLRTNFSAFYVAVAFAGVPFLVTDVAYFFVLGQLLTINSNEIFRTVINFMTLWQVSTLSAIRFRAFQHAKTVTWYSPNRSRLVIGFLYTQGFFTLMGLTYTYATQAHLPYFPPNPWRKLLLVQQVATSVLVNFVFDCVSFKTVWGIRRKALEYAHQRQRRRMASENSAASLWKRRVTSLLGNASLGPAANGSQNELDVSKHAIASSSGSMPALGSGVLGNSGSLFYSDVDEGHAVPPSSPVILTSGVAMATGMLSSGHLPLSPTSPSKPTGLTRRKTREQQRLARFQHTTLIVLSMLVFLVLTSCAGFGVWMTTYDFFGDALSSLCARIYVFAAICHWTQIAHIVK